MVCIVVCRASATSTVGRLAANVMLANNTAETTLPWFCGEAWKNSVCLIYPIPRVDERRRWLGASPQDVPSQALAGSMVVSDQILDGRQAGTFLAFDD